MKRLAYYLGMACMLASCGGGGGDGSQSAIVNAPAPTVPVAPVQQVKSFSGIVAAGAMVEGAEVDLDDLDGRVADTISDAQGGWIIPLAGIKRALKPPFRFHAKFKRVGRSFDLFSMSLESSGDIRVNITPLSDMVTRSYAGDLYSPDDTAWMKTAPDQARLDASIAGVKKIYGDALAGAENLISGSYDRNPNVNGHDAVLEVTEAPVYDNGNVTISDGAGHQIAKTTLAKISNNSVVATDAETISKTEFDTAKVIRGPLPDIPAALKNNAVSVIDKISPLVATVDLPTKFVVTGSNLGRIFDLNLTIENCMGMLNLGGTDTSQAFICTPNAPGTKAGAVQEAVSKTVRSTFSVVVSAPVVPIQAPVIDSITPLNANLNEVTVFTLSGKNFIDGMRFTLEGCSGSEVAGVGTSTTRKFSCTSALSGPNKGEIKDKVDGTVLKSFSVTINKASASKCVKNSSQSYCLNSDGLLEGPYIEYYDNGAISQNTFYVSGISNGPSVFYNSDGTISAEGTNKNGVRDGVWKVYSLKSHQIITEGTFVDGHNTFTVDYYDDPAYANANNKASEIVVGSDGYKLKMTTFCALGSLYPGEVNYVEDYSVTPSTKKYTHTSCVHPF